MNKTSVTIDGVSNMQKPPMKLIMMLAGIIILAVLILGAFKFGIINKIKDRNVSEAAKMEQMGKDALNNLSTIFNYDQSKVVSVIKLKATDVDQLKKTDPTFFKDANADDFVVTAKVANDTFMSVLFRENPSKIINIGWTLKQNANQQPAATPAN